MKFKNIPICASISMTLLSYNVAVHADNLQNDKQILPNNPDRNWLTPQPKDNFWQAPNWGDLQAPQQATQTLQAPALQVPTMKEKAFVTDSAPTEPPVDTNAKSDGSNATDNSAISTLQNPTNNGMPAMNVPPSMPGHVNNFRPPMPQGYYIPPYQQNPYQRPFARPMYPPMYPSMPYGTPAYPPANMYQGTPPPQGMNRPSNPEQMQQQNQTSQPPLPDYRPPAYYPPNYNNRFNNRFNNNNWGNNFWGRSGPGTWTNPTKNNLERGWDDMINTPSRMGTMPGGWSAPEITMPNPIDLGDQFQDNIQDLPEQLRNMDVGN